MRDPDLKAQLGEWYLKARMALTGAHPRGASATDIKGDADRLAVHFHEVPVLVVVCAVMADLLRPDADLDRFGVVGGASIYPSVQNLLLTAREEGLGACLTTVLCRYEPEVKQFLGIPDELLTAATPAIRYPEKPLPTRLSRRPTAEAVFADRFGQALFPA